jgi:hypothetical protein
MGYDPNQRTFKPLADEKAVAAFKQEVPSGVIFTEGEIISIKGCDFKVHEVGHSRLILKPAEK